MRSALVGAMEPGEQTGSSEGQERSTGMKEESASIPGPYDPALTLCLASGVVVLGTAILDPHRLGLLFVPLSFLLTAYAVGTLVGRASGAPRSFAGHVPMLDLSVHLGVGVACLSLLVVATALCGIVWLAGLVAVPLMLVGFWQLVRAGAQVTSSRPTTTEIAGGVILGAAWLVAWLWATIPPTFFDELAYHLVIPQRSLATGHLQATPWVFFTMMPHASDLLLAWGMSFVDALGARATLFALWVVCSLTVWGLAEAIVLPESRSRVAILAACALASSPTLWFLATLPFAETCLTLAVVTGLAVVIVTPTDRRPWLPLGLMLGLAATVKLAGLCWVAAILAAALVAKWPLRDTLQAALVALASILPWWVRAVVHTGNPIYPMGHRLLGGSHWSEESQARVVGDLPPDAMGLGLTGILRLPLDLLQHPERFGSASEAGALAIIAVCLTLALPALLRFMNITEEERRLAYAVTAFMLVAGGAWLFTSTTARFFAPALTAALALLAGAALRLGPKSQVVAMAMLLAAAGWGTTRFVDQHTVVFSSLQVALGDEPADRYLARQLDHYAAARFVQNELPEDAYLLFIGETRPYYFYRKAMAPSAYDRHPLRQWVQEAASAEALSTRVADEGITHVVLNVGEYHRLHRKHGVLRFSGTDAEVNDRRLHQLPGTMRTLFNRNGVVILEVPRPGEHGGSSR